MVHLKQLLMSMKTFYFIKRSLSTCHWNYIGGHAIKIIGWDVEEGVKFWIAVNSWNEGWEEKEKLRILKGKINVVLNPKW